MGPSMCHKPTSVFSNIQLWHTGVVVDSPGTGRGIIYCRISMDREGAGLGVKRQEADCRALAERLGVTVVDVISDNDLSAKKGRRPGYQRLLTQLCRTDVDTLITWHSDRLHRQPKELETFIDVINQNSVSVHFVRSGPIDLTTPAGRLQARIAGAVDAHESEHKAERVAAARKQSAERGVFTGGVRPFGYEKDGVTPVPEEVDGIRRAYDVLLRGGSLRSVLRMLNKEGLRTTRSGNEWDSITARQMLMRARNAGLSAYRGEIVGPAQWPAIVSREELDAITALLKDPRRRTNGHGRPPRWLGSMIYLCGVCRGPMVVGTHGNDAIAGYLCKSLQRGARNHVTRSAENLDRYVVERLLQHLENPDFAAKFAPEPKPLTDVTSLRNKIAALEELGRSMSGRLGRGDISESEYDSFITGNRQQIREAGSRLSDAVVVTPASDLANSGDVRATWKAYDLDMRRAVLRDVVDVTVHPAGRRGGGFDPTFIHLGWH